MLHPSLSVVALAFVGALLAGCEQEASTASPPAEGQVNVVDSDFEPASLEIEAGETVTWVWEGRMPHDVVGDDFDSGVQSDGTFEHTFDEPGTYEYECTLHPGMNGQITVVEG